MWLDRGDRRLRQSTRQLIDSCWHAGGRILLSAVSAWEIALLVQATRLDLGMSSEAWVERFLDEPGVEAVPLDHHAALRSSRLHDLEHRDPADRLLIATAIELACPLVTYDERIVRFAHRHGRQHRFAVAV